MWCKLAEYLLAGADRNCHLSYYRLPTIRLTQARATDPTAVGGTTACLSNIGRRDSKTSNCPYTRVCSLHFVNGKYISGRFTVISAFRDLGLSDLGLFW